MTITAVDPLEVSSRQLPPTEEGCPVPLPITKETFDAVVQATREATTSLYRAEREKFLEQHQIPKRASKAKAESAEKHLYYNDECPFEAPWMPVSSDLPCFPPREVIMAQNGVKGLEPKTGRPLLAFIASGTRFLLLTLREMMECPYMDALLFRFALARHFNYAKCAERVLAFRNLLFRYRGYIGFYLDDDIRAGLQCGGDVWVPRYSNQVLCQSSEGDCCSDCSSDTGSSSDVSSCSGISSSGSLECDEDLVSIPFTPKSGRGVFHPRTPVIITRPRLVKWDPKALSPRQYCKTWFYFALLTVSLDYFGQAIGCVIVGSAKGMAWGNMSKEFQNFTMHVIQHQCLPLKIHRVYAANENFFVHHVLWPVARHLMSKRTAKKMVFVGSNYEKLLRDLGSERIPPELGGTAALPENGEEVLQRVAQLTERAF